MGMIISHIVAFFVGVFAFWVYKEIRTVEIYKIKKEDAKQILKRLETLREGDGR